MKAMLLDEIRSLARTAIGELDRRAETSERVRRARPVVLGTVARGGRVLHTARVVGPTIRPRPVLDEAYFRALAAGRALGALHPLTVAVAAVGSGLDLSVRLYGKPAACAAVTGLGLKRAGSGGGAERVVVPSTLARSGSTVRVAATLPADRFAAPGAAWHVEVLSAHGPLTVVVPSRAALGHRWPRGATGGKDWPARLSCDRHGRLLVTASVPRGPAVDFDVRTGTAGATITWTDGTWTDGTPAGALGLKLRGTEKAVEVPAEIGPDGRHSVLLDANRLRTEAPARWDVTVRAADGTWLPLRRTPGEYPPLGKLVTFAAFPVSMPGGAPLSARIYYTRDNRLAIHLTSGLKTVRASG